MIASSGKKTRNSFDVFERINYLNRGDYSERIMPVVEGHRGSVIEPENTLIAFQNAIKLGCESIELDIWLSKDKIPVVIHGTDKGEVNNTTNGTGLINDLTLDELKALDAGKGQQIPTLREVFQLCNSKIFINCELKDKNTEEALEAVIALIVEENMLTKVAISSFEHIYYDIIKRLNLHESIEFGFLYDDSTSVDKPQEVKFVKRSTINVYYKDATAELVNEAHLNGVAVHCWFKLTDEETEEVLINLFVIKVDVICTNNPQQLLMLREKFFGNQ